MIQKIISTGQPGVGRGALNAAMALDIFFAGWSSTGQYLEGESLLASYRSLRTINEEGENYIKKNVDVSDGTLIVINGVLSGVPDSAQKKTMALDKPCLLIDLNKMGKFQASQSVHEWLTTHNIKILFVVGAVAEENSNIEQVTQSILEATYYLDLIENNMTAPSTLQGYQNIVDPPTSVENAVSQTILNMSLKDRVTMANLSEAELSGIQGTLGDYIRRKLPEWQKDPLFVSSLPKNEKSSSDGDALVFFMIREIWEALQETHKIRIVK